eukprot:Em0013g1066a
MKVQLLTAELLHRTSPNQPQLQQIYISLPTTLYKHITEFIEAGNHIPPCLQSNGMVAQGIQGEDLMREELKARPQHWGEKLIANGLCQERTTIWSSPSMTSTISLGNLRLYVSRTSSTPPPRQRNLSSKIEDHQLRMLFDLASSPAQCARLLSVSSPHASAWLSVMPTPQLNLHLEPPEFQAQCTARHCKQACIGGQLEAGSSLDEEGRQTRPADILVQNSVETHGCWGDDTIKCLDRLAARIAIRTARPKSSVVSALLISDLGGLVLAMGAMRGGGGIGAGGGAGAGSGAPAASAGSSRGSAAAAAGGGGVSSAAAAAGSGGSSAATAGSGGSSAATAGSGGSSAATAGSGGSSAATAGSGGSSAATAGGGGSAATAGGGW